MRQTICRTIATIIATGFWCVPALSQQLVETYTATIGSEDRRNSSGVPLSLPAQVLAQDRANVHRFGITHDGDTRDSVFQTPEMRARFGDLLSRGTLGPGVAKAISSAELVRLSVQVHGAQGNPRSITVMLVDSTASASPLPSQPAVVTRNLPGADAGSPGTHVWGFRQATLQGRQVASLDLQQDGALLAAIRCMMTPDAEPLPGVDPRAGVLTVLFGPSITGPRTSETRSLDISTGSRTTLNWQLVFDEEMNAYGLKTPLTQELSDELERGAKFHLNSRQTGRLHAPIPQAEGVAFVKACSARGIGASITPAFSCDGAGSAAERTICTVPELAALDHQLAAAYVQAPEDIKASQPVWITARDACGTDAACIKQSIDGRIAMLTGQPHGNGTDTFAAPASDTLPGFGTTDAWTTADHEGGVSSTDDVLIGKQAVLDRFLVWTIGQRPSLAAALSIQQRMRGFDFPPSLPEVSPRQLDPAAWQQLLEAAGRLFVDRPPVDVLLEQPVSLVRDPTSRGGPFTVQGATRIGDTAALTQILLQDRNASLALNLEKPFFLPVPQQFTPIPEAMLGRRKGQMLAIVKATLDEHEPKATEALYRGGAARAKVHSVTLVYRPVIKEKGADRDGPDQVLHVWTDQEPSGTDVGRPENPADIADFFGGGVSGGRYVLNSHQLDDAMGQVARGQITESGASGIILNMTLAALLDSQPDRTLSPELAEIVMRELLTERERVDLFPMNIAMTIPDDPPTELELRGALLENDQALRRKVQERSPGLPLAMRYITGGTLGEYDFDAGGFPVHISAHRSPWLPTDRSGETILRQLPDFMPIGPQEGQALIDLLERSSLHGGRRFNVIIDFELATLVARGLRSGPITQQEPGTVQPTFASLSVGLYPMTDPENPFHVVPVPDGFKADTASGGNAERAEDTQLPAELFLTTGKSLLGAIAKLDTQGDIIEQGILDFGALSYSPAATFEERKQNLREELKASALDSYWIGARFDSAPYDPELGGIPLSGFSFKPVGHQEDFDGIEAPPIAAMPEDYAVLRIPPEMAEAVADAVGDKRRTDLYLRVTPASTYYNTSEGATLVLSAPLEAIFEKTTVSSLPRKADIRVALDAPARIEVATGGDMTDIEAPDALMLDPEGIELLALSQAPDMFSDAMFRRMLIARLLKERDAEDSDAALDWGQFFINPAQMLRPDGLDAMLPVFREWTLARAKKLPQRLLLPIGGAGQHSVTGCRSPDLINKARVEMNEPFLQGNLTTLLARQTELSETVPTLYTSNRPKPGPDGILHWTGQGNRGALSCHYVSTGLRSLDRDVRPRDTAFVSAVIMVKALPEVGPVTERPDSYVYELSADDLRVVRPADLDTPPEGLAGVLVLKSDVVAATAYKRSPTSGELASLGHIEKGDWDPLQATDPENADILNLKLEMPLADAVATIRARLPDAVQFETSVPGEGMFGHATALIDPETAEGLIVVYAPHVEGRPVIAIKRRIEFNAAEASVEALKQAFASKYGTEYREDHDNQLFWGGLPQSEDSYGYCGAPTILQTRSLGSVPRMEPVASLGPDQGMRIRVDGFLQEFGWPSDFDHSRGGIIPDITQCGTLVAVGMHRNVEKLYVVTWLFDRRLAERLDAEPRAEPIMTLPEL